MVELVRILDALSRREGPMSAERPLPDEPSSSGLARSRL